MVPIVAYIITGVAITAAYGGVFIRMMIIHMMIISMMMEFRRERSRGRND